MSTAPDRLERYELLDRIAVGGMAEVFRAKATGAHGFEKTLAIKRILPDLARDPEFEQRFINEAKLAVKLSHANVVQVFDFGRFAGSLFIAMEYVEGLDLAALLKVHRSRGEPVDIPSALYIAIEMARGLNFAHQRSVIHRDVSPSNILLSRAGEVKIADFGIAEAVAQSRRDNQTTRRIMGKWRYMSPEQTRAESLTIASDVFAAAAVMYEVFTGDKLFPGDEADQIIENIHSMEIPKASARRAGLPHRVDEILRQALARDAKARPSAAEILRELLDTSYESTIVASALGVSDAVAAVLGARADESGDQIGLDDLIRAQLMESEGRAPTIRKTDIGGIGDEGEQTVVKRGVDADGITVLEIDNTMAAGPVAIRGGKRETSPPSFDDEDGAGADTNEGDPEEESAGQNSGETPAIASAASAHEPQSRQIVPWAMAIALAAMLIGAGGWYFAQARTDSEPVKLPVMTEGDGGDGDRFASVTIESEPAGAQVSINQVVQTRRTPLTVRLDTTVPHLVELRARGYKSSGQFELVLKPGQDLLIQRTLDRLQATLDVRTRPDGASVSLDGKALGTSPVFLLTLPPGAGRRLVIEKTGYRTIEKTIDLEVGRPVLVDERLVSSIVYTQVNINIIETEHGGWADVYLGGARVGRASGQVRLPVGRQTLVLKNSGTGAVKRVTIDVKPGKTQVYRYSLAP